LGPAHVKDPGRRTPRGAIIWRAADGPKPTPEHLAPKDAQARLEQLLTDAQASVSATEAQELLVTLRQAVEGWLAERQSEKGLKRSTVAGYDDMFERLYRDLGAYTPVRDFVDGRLRPYFADFKSFRVMGEKAAQEAKAEGKDVRQVHIRRWTAQPPGSQAVEVASKAEAERLADEMPGTWKHWARSSTMPCANGGWRRTRWPRSSAATRRVSASASCAVTPGGILAKISSKFSSS